MADSSQLHNSAPENEAGNTPVVSPEPTQNGLEFTVSSDVKEVIGKLPKEQSSGTGAQSRQLPTTKTPQERKAELLARLPKEQERAERYMKRQLENTLHQELAELEGKAKHPAHFHELNAVVAKIRQFREILAELAGVTFEYLKTLWLQFVHKLSV